MNTLRGRIRDLADRQHGVVARWQLLGLNKNEIDAALRGWRSVYYGVCAAEDLTELGWLMAAALAGGPGAAISHLSAMVLLGLRRDYPDVVHVSVPRRGGRRDREGLVFHRRESIERWQAYGIPVTSPSQSVRDTLLDPHELYHALDQAENLGYDLTLPLNAISKLQQAVHGRTRSEAEARFILLCHERGLPLPLVNHHLNGIETDFHWPDAKLVVEVDGYEFHKERPQFEEDRRRGLVHTAAGWTVIRVSAAQVQSTPDLVVRAVRQASADRRQNSMRRRKRPK